MKARLLSSLAGERMYDFGEVVEGEMAVKLIAAGLAEQIETEERATAPLSRSTKKKAPEAE